MSSKSWVCPICNKNVRKTEYSVACSGCKSYFHPKCIHISDSEVKSNKTLKYTCNNCSAGKRKSGENVERLFDGFRESVKKQMDDQIHKCMSGFREIVDRAVEALRAEFLVELRQIREEVDACKQELADVRNKNIILQEEIIACKEQFKSAERQNSIVQRRLNRADILISGLPQSIINLREPVTRVAHLCNVELNPNDIQHCCYIYGGKTILVKFNSIHTRDRIMANYFRTSIRLKDVIDCDVQSRIYLKDHLTPAAARLVNTCRKLRDKKKVHKYVLINGDSPMVRLMFVDGNEIVQNADQCQAMLDGDLIPALHNNPSNEG